MWRHLPHGGQVVTPLNDDGSAFLPVSEGSKFVFEVRPINSEFSFFTDLSEFPPGTLRRFTNVGSSGGTLVLSEPDQEQQGRRPAGVLAFVEVAQQDPLAVGTAALPESAPVLLLPFHAKRARWAYYVVTDVDSPDSLRIANADSSHADDDPDFSSSAPTVLGEDDSFDPIVQRLARQYGDVHRLRFLSDNDVSCRERVRDRLVLRIEEDALIDQLPNPSPKSFSTIGVDQSPSLFHVVRYVTRL